MFVVILGILSTLGDWLEDGLIFLVSGLLMWLIYEGIKKIILAFVEAAKGGFNYFSLRADPKQIQVLLPLNLTEQKNGTLQKLSPIPEIQDSWFSIGKNKRILKEYVVYLEYQQKRLYKLTGQATGKFQVRNRHLNNQQLQLVRRIIKARRYINHHIAELKRLNLSAENQSINLRELIPKQPEIPHIRQINAKERSGAIKTGGMAGAAIAQSGGNVVVGAIILAGFLVKGKSDVSKLKRAVENAFGEITNYALECQLTIEKLEGIDKLHNIPTSVKLKEAETSIIKVVDDVRKIPRRKSLDQLDSESKSNITELYKLIIHAYGISGRKMNT